MENRIVTSPCSTPLLPLEAVFETHGQAGLRHIEGFTSWVQSALDWRADPAAYLALAARHGFAFASLHLPPVTGPESVAEAAAAARFAEALGCRVVLFKADSRERYIAAGPAFLEATADLGVTPVVQNHAGSPITTLEDMLAVLEGIGDPRMRALLEVGHFHTAGVPWRRAAEALEGRIALVHFKDQIGPQSVPLGTGEIDLPGLFDWLRAREYRGDYVLEMEVADSENTLRYLASAVRYLAEHCGVRA